ncbi:hypothetical protein BX666DRAFT_1888707 [Dichotomocladium elegans]|nr:hypothetical protein BX666DRAFT_1888707 [Dichotomocladium elegans]
MDMLPAEILMHILKHMSLADLVRTERTCKLIQQLCLCEIEHRILSDPRRKEWSVLVHLEEISATAVYFDRQTRQVTYQVDMPQPIHIKTMFDHRRQIQCCLLQHNQYREGFVVTVEKGMQQGLPVPITAKSKSSCCSGPCSVHGVLIRAHHERQQEDKKKLAPSPLVYSLQLSEMQIPLSTLAAQ